MKTICSLLLLIILCSCTAKHKSVKAHFQRNIYEKYKKEHKSKVKHTPEKTYNPIN